MGVELPADLTRDYDMLELLEEEDDGSSVVPTTHAAPALTDSPKSDGTSASPSSSSSSPANSLNLEEFLLEDELFLRGMEDSADAIDVDPLPGLDMMLPLPESPFGSPWPSAGEVSPLFPLEPNTEEEEEAMAPLKLSHCDSSSSGHTEEEEEDNDEEVGVMREEDEVELLQREKKYLTAQKEFLEFKDKSRPQRRSVKARRGRGAAERMKVLLKCQEDNQLLNRYVMQQKMFADNFKAMLVFAPVNDMRLSLMTPLESYIRLGKDWDDRRRTILALRKEKLDMTYKFIEQKAVGLDCNKPHEFSDMFDKFGKHYCVNFTISRYDGVSVYQIARGIYNQLTEKDETLNEAIGITAERESTGTLQCNFMHQRIISRPTQRGRNSVKMPDMESNGVFYCRFGEKSAVLATDYVDHDELHPYDELNRIRKDVSSGVVISEHEDADGKKYIVVKRFTMAKLHMYPHRVSQTQQDRFFLNMFHSHDNMKRLVVDRVLQHKDSGCSCTGNKTGCCCASDESSIPCGGHAHHQESV